MGDGAGPGAAQESRGAARAADRSTSSGSARGIFSADGRRRVFILDGAETMRADVSNVFLKY